MTAWAVPLARDVVLVEGPDAATYLQGQLSQDVAALPVAGSAWSLLLTPQGHLVALLRVTRTAEDAFALDGDAGTADDVLTRLTRFLLRTKATVTAAEGWSCVAVRGDGDGAGVPPALPPGVFAVAPETPGLPGYDLLGAGAAAPAGTRAGAPEDYEALRIERGVPRVGAELGERTIPAEAGIVDRTTSFTKGCYTGQELVARIDSRGGNVPRRLRGVVVDGDHVPPPGASVLVDGLEVGALTSSARSTRLGAPVALAYAKRGTAVPGPCTLRWEGGAAVGRLAELPPHLIVSIGARRSAPVLLARALLARALLALAVLVPAACAPADAFPPLPDVGAVTTVAPRQVDRPDRSGVALPTVGGTTTTSIGLGPGRSRLLGRVEGPAGPIVAGVVRIERLVGDGGVREDVPIRPDGTFDRPDLLGGRYRIRAFAAPTFAQLQPEVLFLQDGPTELVLRVEQLGIRDVDAVIAPDPPRVDDRANLVVRVADRTVGGDGIVRTVPLSGITVTLTGGPAWGVIGQPSGVTTGSGEVLFTVVCSAAGSQPLAADLDGLVVVPLALPACAARPAPTTTTTSTTEPSGTDPSTTTTTRPGTPTSSTSSTTSTTTAGLGG